MSTNFDFQGLFWPTLTDQIRLLPIYILQLVGAMGVFSFTLIALRGRAKPISTPILYGMVFGVTGYFMTGLVAEFLGSQFKPYIRLELLFLVSMLGGLARRPDHGGAHLLGTPAVWRDAAVDDQWTGDPDLPRRRCSASSLVDPA